MEIATILSISSATVKLHGKRILQKAGAENRTAAALIAYEYAIIPPQVED